MRVLVSFVAIALFASFYMYTSFAADGKVQFKDITKANANFVEVAPVAASTNERISVIVHSFNQDILKTIFTTLQEVEATTGKDVVMLQAAPVDGQDGFITIGYFYDGVKTGTSTISVNTADTPLREHIITAIEDGISTTEQTQ